MVVVPLGALSLLGVRVVRQHAILARHQVRALLEDRLHEVDASVRRLMDERERELLKVASAVPDDQTDAIRAHLDRVGRSAEVLIVDLDGRVRFPPLGAPMSGSERDLLERTRTVWDGDALQTEARRAHTAERPGADHGWFGFFHGGGLNLLLWRVDGDRIVAVELSRIALLSDLVAHLPATSSTGEDDRTPSRIVLTDESGTSVYQWGSYQPPSDEPARATLPLSAPLAAWSLRDYSPESALPSGLSDTLTFNLGIALLAVALALFGLAFYLYHMRTREMRVAAQRVSFVNQVSHELKTPLTNIRLYAELLANELGIDPDDPDATDDPAARHLGVITGESQRLSRLISNVLTFARGQEGRLSVSPRPRVLDEVVRAVRATFGPSLEQAGVQVILDLGAPERALVDADAVEQILANLLSNVEKYARSGGEVRVTTRRDGDTATIRVADLGPGIPAAHREEVFLPFRRLSDKLTDGAAGTGIGLDIARQLARLHGGELRLVDAERGACFALTLHTPLVLADPPSPPDQADRPGPPDPEDTP